MPYLRKTFFTDPKTEKAIKEGRCYGYFDGTYTPPVYFIVHVCIHCGHFPTPNRMNAEEFYKSRDPILVCSGCGKFVTGKYFGEILEEWNRINPIDGTEDQ